MQGVDFTTPNWMASPAADFGLNLWGDVNTSSLTLEDSATDFMLISGRTPGASSSGGSLQNLLAQSLSVIQGAISNGPVSGTVRGKRTESFYVQFTVPNGTQDNGLAVYWFSSQADIAVLCGWANSETGVTMQDACRATLASLGATAKTPSVSAAVQNSAVGVARAFTTATFSYNWKTPTANESLALGLCTPKFAVALTAAYKAKAALLAYSEKEKLVMRFTPAESIIKAMSVNGATIAISGKAISSIGAKSSNSGSNKAAAPTTDSATVDLVRMGGRWFISNLVSTTSVSIG